MTEKALVKCSMNKTQFLRAVRRIMKIRSLVAQITSINRLIAKRSMHMEQVEARDYWKTMEI